MGVQFTRFGRAIAYGAVSLALIGGSLTFATGSAAQTAPSAHDAAIDATHKGDYITALALSKQAAAAGQPLDPDQVDFIAGKAAKQQAAADESAKIKATQVAAAATAQEIQERQQKDYADRAKRQKLLDNCSVASGQQAMAMSQFTSSYGGAANQVLGAGNIGGAAFSGTPASPAPLSNENPGGACSSSGGGNPGSRIVK